MRTNILYVLTLAILSSMTTAACGEGCVKCNTEIDNCLFCDFTLNYVMNNEQACSTKKREQCEIMDSTGDCLRCTKLYYFDRMADACLQVPQINRVVNCEYYTGLNTCHICQTGFYLEDGVCRPAKYLIDGCYAYSSGITCGECHSGYVLHPSGNRCVSTSSSDCLFQNHLKCEACAPGYALDYNYFINGIFGQTQVDGSMAVSFIKNASIQMLSYSNLKSPCRPLLIENCEDYESFTLCKKCANNYYLSDNKTSCKVYPHPIIPNCEGYSYYNNCNKCAQGFRLAGYNDCQPVRSIDKCLAYSQTSAANVCVECQSGYFVSANTCNLRVNIVPNCQIYNASEDKCQTCGDGLKLTTDGLACLPIIVNCVTYQSSNKSTTQLVCQECADGYYYDTSNTFDTKCISGEVANCKNYPNNSPLNCQVCKNEYYLEGGLCKAHDSVTKCATYSNTNPHECTACDNTSFLTTQNIGCAIIPADIPLCNTYESPTLCKKCENNYYISNGSCLTIPASENCVKRVDNSTLCAECKKGYLLNAGVCSLPLDFQTHNCFEIQNDGLASEFVCNKCKKNTMALDYNGQYICRKTSVLGNNLITNCKKYELVGVVYKCKGCSTGYYLSDSNTCVNNIINTATKALVLNHPTVEIVAGNLRKITDSTDTYMTVAAGLQDCKHVVYTNDFSEKCLTCKSGKIPIVNIGNHKSHINPAASDPSTFTPVLGYGYNTFTCVTIGTPTYFPSNGGNPSANCDTFVNNGNNVYCKSCKRGYTGKVQSAGAIRYQNCDVVISDCNTDVTYGGLIFEYDNNHFSLDPLLHLSCHSCYTANKIPVMFGDTDGDIEPFSLTKSDNIPNAEAALNDSSVQCLEINAESFNYKPEQLIGKFVENCGVAKYNTNVTKMISDLDDYTDSPLVCALCKPGYMPIRLNNIIVRCDPIAHCNTRSSKQWFNTCGECQTGYTWFFNPDDKFIDFSRCVPMEDKNCLAAVTENDALYNINTEYPKGKCAMCKNGYTFNLDYVCEAINAPLCKTGQYVKGNYMFNLGVQYIDIYNIFNKNHDGCHECESSSYVPLRHSTELFACTTSTYLEQGNFPEKTEYIDKCRHHSRDGTVVICRECEEGYITSTNGKYCVDQETYPNCEKANVGGENCEVCQTGYVLVNEFCEKPRILNCETYDSGLDYQRCLVCIDEFKLVSNKCVQGHVDNCKTYNNAEVCLQCKNDYALVSLANSQQVCLRINEELNCQVLDTTKLNATQQLECTTCKEGYAPTIDNKLFEKYVCQNITPVTNCKLYDTESLPILSSFKCIECESQFYLNNNTCIGRMVTTTNCAEYSKVNDFCTVCEDGFYLSNEKACINYPRGIYGCIEYKNEETCVSCDKNMYLSGTTCNTVTNALENCMYYKDNSTCRKCKFNYFLQENTCLKAKALNCSTYSRIDRCESCLKGFGLQQNTKTGVIDCVYIPEQNCSISEDVYPFNCKECKPLFYNENGRCLAVEQAIENCGVYDSPVTCSRCKENFILALSKKRCLTETEAGIQPYQNCIDNRLTVRPQCNVCKPGHKLVNGACVACKKNTTASGCMYCDGDEDQSCIICTSGYYMNKENKCFKNSSAPSALAATDADSR